MLTTDLSLRFDPAYEKISRRFLRASGTSSLKRVRPAAWFKLTHRDMGPIGGAISAHSCRRRDADLAGPDFQRWNHPLIGGGGHWPL